MVRKIKKVASRGSVNKLILKALSNGEKYGYEIIQDIFDSSNGKINLKQPSLYSSLNRYEDKGYVTSYWTDSEIGGKRHYYKLTPLGHELYLSMDEEDGINNKEDKSNDYKVGSEDDLTSDSKDETSEEFLLDESENYESTADYLNKYTKKFDVKNIVADLLKSNDDNKNIINDNNLEDFDEYDDKEIDNSSFITYKKDENIQPVEIKDDTYDREVIKQGNIASIQNKIDNLKYTDNNNNNEPLENNKKITNETDNKQITSNVKNIISKLKISSKKINKKLINSPYNKLYFKQLIKKTKKKIVKDQNGIFHLVDEDYNFGNKLENPIDNVGIRQQNKSYALSMGGEKKSTTQAPTINENKTTNYTSLLEEKELTEEEKLIRAQKFIKKFEFISNERANKKKDELDYKNILGDLYTDDADEEEYSNILDENYSNEKENQYVNDLENNINKLQTTNSLSSVDENNFTDYYNNENESFNDEKTINLEFEEKNFNNTDNQSSETYTNLPNNFNQKLNSNSISLNSKPIKKFTDKEFILTNKIKLSMFFILTLITIVELTCYYIIAKQYNLFINNDLYILYGGYALSIIILFGSIINYLIAPRKRKESSFRFGTSFSIGAVTFLVLCIIIYAINTFIGMEFSLIQYYITSLVIPGIFALNFVFMPIIYGILYNNDKFY